MNRLVEKVLSRVAAGNVTILVDVPATLQARKRWPSLNELVVGSFEGQMTLYRVFDGEEMAHILTSGKITGGKYSIPAERSMGASWANDISAVIRMGNAARGKRLGQKIYLAKLDATGKQFLHLGPEVQLDTSVDEQRVSMPKDRCNPGLGCSVANVSVGDIDDFYEVLPNDQISKVPMSLLTHLLREGGLTGDKTAALRVAARVIEAANYFEIGNIVLTGKYKNGRAKIIGFGQDKWGNPTVILEPIPKGRKQNKEIGLYKIWRADVKENAIKKQLEEAQAKLAAVRLPAHIPMNTVWKQAPELVGSLTDRQSELLEVLAKGGTIGGGKTGNIVVKQDSKAKGEVSPEAPLMHALLLAGWVRFATQSDTFGYYWLTDTAEKVWKAHNRKGSP